MDDFDFKFKNAKVSALKQLYGDLKPEFQDGGSVTTPKRGLVDEPGSYAGKGRGNPTFTEPEKLYEKMAQEYDQVLQTAVDKKDFRNVPEFKEWAVDNYGKEFNKRHYRKNVTKLAKLKYFETQSKLLDTLIDEANQGLKYKSFTDLQQQAGYSKKTGMAAGKGSTKYGRLDTAQDKLKKGFDYLFSDLDKPVSEMFDSMKQLQELTGLNVTPGKYLKGYEPYEQNKRLIKNLSTTLSKQRLARNPNLPLGELQFRLANNVKDTNLFAPPRRMNMETKIMDIAGRHVKQGGDKIQWLSKPGKTELGYPDYSKAKFKYNGQTYDLARLTQSADVDPNFKELFQIEDQIKELNAKEVIHPKTKQPVRFDDLMRETYGYKPRMAPYAVDHFKQISNEPFTSLRILPSRVNSSAGTTTQYGEEFITDPRKKQKYTKVGKEKILKKIGYNYQKPFDQLIKDELNLAEDVLVRGRKLRSPSTIVDELYFTETKTKAVSQLLGDLGCGKAGGGRIKFAEGSNCVRKGLDIMENADVKNTVQAKKIMNIAKEAGNPKQLKSILNLLVAGSGAAIVAEEVIAETLFAANGLLKGKPLKEAWADSYLSYIPGLLTGKGLDKKSSKDLAVESFKSPNLTATNEIQNIDEQLNSLEENRQTELNEVGFEIEGTTSDITENQINQKYDQRKKELINKRTVLKNKLTGGLEANINLLENKLINKKDSEEAKSIMSEMGLRDQLLGIPGIPDDMETQDEAGVIRPEARYKNNKTIPKLDIPNYLNETYLKPFKKKYPDLTIKDLREHEDEQGNRVFNDAMISDLMAKDPYSQGTQSEDAGFFGETINKERRYYPKSSYIQSPFQREEENRLIEEGARLGAAGGGIMKMAGKRFGGPPESGPEEGLASLMKYDNKY